MKQEEAAELVAWMALATGTELTPERRGFWEALVAPLDAEIATETVRLGCDTWKFFPKQAEFKELYRGMSKVGEASEEHEQRLEELESKPVPGVMPLWLKRYACARFLYSRFDREQDMRPFVEQGDEADPLAERMPADSWLEEAAKITDADAWTAIRAGAFA